MIESRPPDLRSICERLVRVRFLNAVAVRGLALFDDPAIGKSLARNYRAFHPSERPAAIETLVSRPAFARALLDQIAAGQDPAQRSHRLPRPADPQPGRPGADRAARRGLGRARATRPPTGGTGSSSSRSSWTPPTLAAADRGRGRAVFDRVCASCHRLYGQGGEIGPDLTGSGRDNLDYLLENIVDPERHGQRRLPDGRRRDAATAASSTAWSRRRPTAP